MNNYSQQEAEVIEIKTSKVFTMDASDGNFDLSVEDSLLGKN